MRIRWQWMAFAAVLAIAKPALADTSFGDLASAYDKASYAWGEDIQKRADEGQMIKMGYSTHPIIEYFPKIQALSEQAEGRKAVDPSLWILQNAGQYGMATEKDVSAISTAALEKLRTTLIADEKLLKRMLPEMTYLFYEVPLAPLRSLYESILDGDAGPKSKAQASFNLALALYSDFTNRGDADEKQIETDKKQATSLFLELPKKYPDSSVVKDAKPFIYEIENLQVGMTAPQIIGQTVDDEKIMLSQFQGQVVVLDFWGFW